MIDEQAKPKGNTLSVNQIAALCGRSRQWVFQLVKAGFIAKQAHGDYTLVSVVRGVIDYGSIRISYAHGPTGRIPTAAARTARGVGCLGSTAR